MVRGCEDCEVSCASGHLARSVRELSAGGRVLLNHEPARASAVTLPLKFFGPPLSGARSHPRPMKVSRSSFSTALVIGSLGVAAPLFALEKPQVTYQVF